MSFLSIHIAVFPQPKKLDLILAGKAKEKQSSIAGNYILANGDVNGYPNWLKTDGIHAIWFEKENSIWMVGLKSNLGMDDGEIIGPAGKDSSPNEISQGWSYSIGEDDPWADAAHLEIIFKVISMSFNLSFWNQVNLFTSQFLFKPSFQELMFHVMNIKVGYPNKEQIFSFSFFRIIVNASRTLLMLNTSCFFLP